MSLTFVPIGHIKSSQIKPYQASKQPDQFSQPAVLRLYAWVQPQDSLQELETVTHIWVIYQFHHNTNWKPKVLTPRTSQKIGVFATRAPYRPNAIGLSLVKLEHIILKKNGEAELHLGPNDLLDNTPVMDIKPYHPEFDLEPQAQMGWLNKLSLPEHHIIWSKVSLDQINFIEHHKEESPHLENMKNTILRQLQFDPLNDQKKRVSVSSEMFDLSDDSHASANPKNWEFELTSFESGQLIKSSYQIYTLSYRTWRIDFIILENHQINILKIRSGYSQQDLQNTEQDPYQDKAFHLKFNKIFNQKRI